jgi:uncharacterized membrane protein
LSDLIIIGYDDEATAERAFGETERLQKDMLLDLNAAAVVHRTEDGKLKVETPHEHAGSRAAPSGASSSARSSD